MTNEDALDSLCEDCVHYPCYALKHGDNCLAYNTIKKAIEKQIPKKPINWLGKMLICPRCNRADYIKPLESYCKFCGQLIDWSKGNDE